MNFEKMSTPDAKKDVPKITTEEWLKYSGGSKDDEEFEKWMEEKGIKLNNGITEIDLDGKVVKINTNEDGFGEIIQDPDAIVEGSKV